MPVRRLPNLTIFFKRVNFAISLIVLLVTIIKEKYDPGFLGSIALGYKISDQFRIEGEGLFQSNDMDKAVWSYTSSFFSDGGSYALKGERERIAFLLNGYFDFKNSTPFTPYITAGLGGYHMRLKYQNQSYENDLDFAWQAGAGVNYALNDQISFDLKYRYFGGSDAEIQLPGNTISNSTRTQLFEVGDHQVMAGVRVGF